MHGEHRIEPVRLRRDDLAEARAPDLGQHQIGAARRLEAGHELAVEQLGFAVLQAVIIAVDRDHSARSPPLGGAASGSISPVGSPSRLTRFFSAR
jgi:hypothetical protein